MCIPKIDVLLQAQPHLRRGPERASQAVRHVGRDRPALVQYFANRAARDAKQPRKLILRQTRCGQDILAQNLAGMRGSSLTLIHHRSVVGAIITDLARSVSTMLFNKPVRSRRETSLI